MAYHPREALPQQQAYDSSPASDGMAQRHNSWAPPPGYGPLGPAAESYHFKSESPRLPPPSGLSYTNSQPRPMAQAHQTQYRPEYYQYHDYHHPPSPSYHQAPSQYQHYQPPPHPAQVHDRYRAQAPRYPVQELTPDEFRDAREQHMMMMRNHAPAMTGEPNDEFREAREQHLMMRNQAPAMSAPRVHNANYDGKVAIPFTPLGLRIPPVRSGSTAPATAWSATTDRAVKIEDLCHGPLQPVKHEFVPKEKPVSLPNEYEIFFRQQPVAARCCGYGERDRRVIDPPPIVQLRINNPNLTPDEVYDRLHFPSYVVHCSIWNEHGLIDETDMPPEFVRPGKRIMGSLVSSPFVGEDEHGQQGCFFCFPDMSVRTPGLFRLKFSLVVVHPRHKERKAPIKSTIMSDVFQVFNAKDFPGMQASTPLTKRLKEQGCLISIKKGNEKSGGKSRRQVDSDEDDEGGGSSTKRKKSKKQR